MLTEEQIERIAMDVTKSIPIPGDDIRTYFVPGDLAVKICTRFLAAVGLTNSEIEMKLAGVPQTAKEVADELHAIWFRHGDDVCAEQIEAHMESDGFTLDEIDIELDRLGLWHGRMYEIVIVPPG